MTNVGPFSQNDLDTLWAMSDAQKKEREIQVLSDDEAEQAMTINTLDNGTISVRRKPDGRWQDMNVGLITEYDDD
ncbi:hypothetical protein FMN52_19085 [Marinobacter sp. BW6]|uniref:hypothetical protein n=1 Tax=Marinobacter sp. BW6 TaxID=2592624 RepID=UPI0011DEB269|nr:hypothetical protein [Marinobacter sp. BW6]TYC53224.1 hypothetical protein FMN52_19085 [Marinobacter sp. BW6]